MSQFFGAKLRWLRHQRGWTQADVAHRLSLATHSHVSYLERGKSHPSLGIVVQVANIFLTSIDYLLQDAVPLQPVITLPPATPPAELAAFAIQLRYLREQRQWSQATLALHLAPTSQSFVSYLETGDKYPSPEMLIRCAELFDTSCDMLLRAVPPGTS